MADLPRHVEHHRTPCSSQRAPSHLVPLSPLQWPRPGLSFTNPGCEHLFLRCDGEPRISSSLVAEPHHQQQLTTQLPAVSRAAALLPPCSDVRGSPHLLRQHPDNRQAPLHGRSSCIRDGRASVVPRPHTQAHTGDDFMLLGINWDWVGALFSLGFSFQTQLTQQLRQAKAKLLEAPYFESFFRHSVERRGSPLASTNTPTPFMVRCSTQRHPPRPRTPPSEPPSARRKFPDGMLELSSCG